MKSTPIFSPFPYCYNCSLIPFLTIFQNKVHIICSCNFNQIISIKEYLKFIKKGPFENTNLCSSHQNSSSIAKCSKCSLDLCVKCLGNHSYNNPTHLSSITPYLILPCSTHQQLSKSYCTSCNIYLCPLCINKHDATHFVQSLFDLTQLVNIEEIKEQIEHGYRFINIDCPKIKEESKEPFNEEEILIYEETIENSRDILSLVSILISSFTYNFIAPYSLISNLQRINLNIPIKKKDESSNSFFLNNQILNITPIHLEKIKLIKTVEGNKKEIFSLIIMSNGTLVTCSNDSINFFKPIEYNSYLEIKNAHDSEINSICELDEDTIASCSNDKSMKIWSIEKSTYQCILKRHIDDDNHFRIKKYFHTDIINKLISIPFERFASCSDDNTIKIWSVEEPYQCITTIQEHSKKVTSILLMSKLNIMVSGSLDGLLCVWDIDTVQLDMTINDVPCDGNNKLIELDSYRVCVGYKYKIKIVNIEKGQIELSIENNYEGNFSCLILKEKEILCGGTKGEIYWFDVENNCFRKREDCVDGEIKCMIAIENDIIVCGKEMRIWKCYL